MSPALRIDDRDIGPDHPPYIVAEMSANHGGRLSTALQIIDRAAEAGADAVKLQTYTPSTMTLDIDDPSFRVGGGLWEGRSLYELYQEAHTPWDWHASLFQHGAEQGVTVFSSPFDASAVELLEELGTPAYKIASFEAVDHPLIRAVASTRKPLILSTGMATMGEVEEAVQVARDAGADLIALLHAVSAYPTPASEANLPRLIELSARFGTVVGLSDHTLGTDVAVAAVALGASIVEKHFTLSRASTTPDAAFSLEPREFAQLVQGCKTAWEACKAQASDSPTSEDNLRMLRRSIYVVRDLSEGDELTNESIRVLRPGYGLAPRHLSEVLGRKASRPIKRGTPLSWKDVT